MADETNPIVSALQDISQEDFTTSYRPLSDLAQATQLGHDLTDRNTLGDSAVGILDTLQSLGSLALAPLPEYELQDSAENSSILDEFRSPAYLAERVLEAQHNNPNAGFIEGAGEGISDVISGGNVTADAAAQIPYLLLGPAGRLSAVARAEKAAGILGKVAKYTLGTNEAATINRIAAFSGAIEAQGAYAQTYQRAIDQGLGEDEAVDQAQKAALVSGVVGAGLGRLTPGFELHPTGKGVGDLLSHLSAIGGEAIVEEGGLAVTQQVTDNILAGRDPMEGVGEQFGQAAAISTAFAGALRTPRTILATAKAVGKGVVAGLGAVGSKTTTPEGAAANAADAANQAPPATEQPAATAAPDVVPEPVATELPPAPTVDEDASDRRFNPAQRKAIDEMSPEEKSAEIARLRDQINNPLDQVTGLTKGDQLGEEGTTPLQRKVDEAILSSNDPENQPQWVSFDIGNLGGLNEHVNNQADEANKHYRALVDIAQNTLKEFGFGTDGVRTGGDEFAILAQGGDISQMEEAKQAIRDRVHDYTVANGLDQIKNPKGKAPGLSLHVGSTQIVPIDTIESVRNRADRDLDASKKGTANVRRVTPKAPRENARNERSQKDVGAGSEARPSVRDGDGSAPQETQRSQVDTNSSSETIKSILVEAATDQVINNTTGAEQAAAISRKEELAPIVRQSKDYVEKLPDATVEKYVEQSQAGDAEAARRVQAIARTDISKLPEKAIPENLRPAVKKLKELKDLKLDKTSNEILESGFNKAQDSRGMRGYLQDVINTAALGVDGPNENASELERFNDHLQARAQAFREALASNENNPKVEGTRTKTERGGLQDKPFIIHKLNANSMATVQRVFDDALKAQEVVDTLRQSFPKMFKPVAPVVAAKEQAPVVVAPVEAPVAQTVQADLSLPLNQQPQAVQDMFPDELEDTPNIPFSEIYDSVVKQEGGVAQAAALFAENGITIPATQSTQAEVQAVESTPAPAAVVEKAPAPVVEPVAEEEPTAIEGRQVYQFAVFNDINRFNQAFIPNGTGLFANNYADVVAALAIGTDDEKKAAKLLGDIVPQFTVAINKYVAKVLNGPVSASDSTKLKDALSNEKALLAEYPNYVWVHALANKPDGSFELHPAVVQSAAVAAVMQMVRAAFQRSVIDPDATSDETDDLYYQWLQNVGRDLTRVLGVVEDKNESLTLTDGIPKSLAATVLEVLATPEKKGANPTLTVTTSKERQSDGSIKTLKNISMSDGVRATLRQNPAFAEVMRKIFGDSDDDTIHYGAPPAGVKPTYRNSRTSISAEQRTANTNRQQVVHSRNTEFLNVINALGDAKYTQLVTGFSDVSNDEQLEKLSRSLVVGMRGELNAVVVYNAGVEKHARENNMAPEAVPVHFSYETLSNGRSYSGFSPQTKTTLRQFLTVGRETLDLTYEPHLEGLKLAIAQNLGIKTDVNDHSQIIQKLHEIIPSIRDKATAIYRASQGEQVDNLFQLLDRDQVYDPKELHALITLGKWLSDMDNTKFDNTLTYEIDGKTNGPFNAELLFGLWMLDKKSQMNLEQGGFFFNMEGATLASMQDYLRTEYGSADLYERVAKNTAALNDPILTLAGFTDAIGAISRIAAKEAVTPLVYGSGVPALSRVFDVRINNGLAERLRLALKQNDTALVNKLRGLIGSAEVTYLAEALSKALDKSYSDQKPQVTTVNKLMVAATTLHAGIRKALFEAKVASELEGQRASGLLPKQYDLSRNAYNKILAGLPNTGVTVPGMGDVQVGESANTGRSGSRVEGAGKVNSVQISKPEIEMPGVAILALLTQAAGDAAMGNHLFQTFHQVLDVYDGIEMKVSQIDSMGLKLNDAVWKSSSDALLDGFIPLLDWVIQNEALVSNPDTAKTLETLRQKYKVPNNIDAVRALRAELIEKSAQIKEGRARLNAKPSSLNQMSGGSVPYVTEVTNTTPQTRQSSAKSTVSDKAIEAGFAAASNTLDRDGIVTMLDGFNWKNRVHQYVWNTIRNRIPAGVVANLNLANEQQLTDGEYNLVTKEISLRTSDPAVLLHELLHSVVSTLVENFHSNPQNIPVELRQPLNNLSQLLQRFDNLNGPAARAIGAVFNDQNRIVQMDEMLAHVLTDRAAIAELQPSFIAKVVLRVKQLLWALVGKSVPDAFIDEAINVLGQLAAVTPMEANPYAGIRSHTNTATLEAQTLAAFNTIATKVARGQLKGVPKVKDSHLKKLQTVFNLDANQQKLYLRTWMLLRMDTRSGATERYASTVLLHHPQASVFNGVTDPVAVVMALTAVNDTFRAQADAIWRQHGTKSGSAEALVDLALHKAPLTDGATILDEALDTMRQEGEYNLSYLGTATQRLDRMGNEWMEKIGDTAFTASETAPRGISEGLAAISALTSEVGAEAFGKSLLRYVNEFTSQRWLQDGIASLVGSQDDTNTVYRQVNSMKSNIAQTRSLFTTVLPAQLKTLFPEGFDGWNHLYEHFGRIDAGVLGTAAGEMYRDDAARQRAIKALESKVANIADAKNLAHYMIHGSVVPGSPHALLRNARAIADNLNGTKRKAPESLVADVDQLVTLYAIDKLFPTERARIAGYFTTHTRSMENLTGMLQKIAEEEIKQYDEAYRYAYWKGALPLSTDPRTSVVVAGAVRGAQLEKLGYKKAKRYATSSNDPATDLHYYTRDYAPPPVFTQGVLATVQQTSQGVNYTTAASISPEVGTIITNSRLVAYVKNNQGTNSTLVPIFNFEGDIAGYERLLDRDTVQTLTRSNNTLLHIAIGAKLGRIAEERMANRFNQEAIKILVDQWKTGVTAGEQAQYEDVTSTTDKQIARAWEVIPAPTKKALTDAFGGPVMIRKDLIANTLGYHKAGIADIYTGNASLPEEVRRGLYGLAQTIFLGHSAKYLYAAELAIKEAVATAKDWIVVRSVSVAINNAMASMNLVIANGVPIKELFSSYREGMADIRTYSKLQREIIGLSVKIAGANAAEAARLKTIQHGKYEAIKKLAIYPLIEAGELSDLPEGLEESPKHSYLGDLSGWLNNHLRYLHPKLPAIAGNAIIAKDTAFHDAISKAIQAGDFLGKWAVYKHMVKSGKSVEVARDTVRDEFISYSTNPGRFRGALEDFGLVWWSQFTLRAQKVLLRRFRKNPFSFFLSAGVGELTGADAPSDASLTERGWDNSTGLDNVINAPSAHIWAKVF